MQPAMALKNALYLSIIFTAIGLLLPFGGFAAEGRQCLFYAENEGPTEFPDCLTEKNGSFFVAPQYLKKLSFKVNGLAVVHAKNEGWMYADRKGKIIIKGVAAQDNWADSFHDGLVRFLRNNKWGFADARGRVIIAPVYDGALNFNDGKASVCKGCKLQCTYTGCEQNLFSGGEWLCINKKGKVIKNCQPQNK